MTTRLDVSIGCDTIINFELGQFNWTGIEKLIFTMKNSIYDDVPVIYREITESEVTNGVFEFVITAEESGNILPGAEYDIDVITSKGLRIKVGRTGWVNLRRNVGTIWDVIETEPETPSTPEPEESETQPENLMLSISSR